MLGRRSFSLPLRVFCSRKNWTTPSHTISPLYQTCIQNYLLANLTTIHWSPATDIRFCCSPHSELWSMSWYVIADWIRYFLCRHRDQHHYKHPPDIYYLFTGGEDENKKGLLESCGWAFYDYSQSGLLSVFHSTTDTSHTLCLSLSLFFLLLHFQSFLFRFMDVCVPICTSLHTYEFTYIRVTKVCGEQMITDICTHNYTDTNIRT